MLRLIIHVGIQVLIRRRVRNRKQEDLLFPLIGIQISYWSEGLWLIVNAFKQVTLEIQD